MMQVTASALVFWVLLQCPELRCYYQYGRDVGVSSPSYHRSWTTWTSWSHCSRTCGGGIIVRTRLCRRRTGNWLTEKSGFCPGETTEYRVCNTKDCPNDAINFRQYQCALYNNRVIARKYVKEWIPYEKGVNKCELKCQEKGSDGHYSFGKVADGTECSIRSNRKEICVNGRCLVIGCDGKVGSDTHLDICGICGGRNDSCVFYRNTYLKQPIGPGYEEIAIIPAGSTHLLIRDISHKNDLALMDSKYQYVINGPGMISYPGEYHVMGTIVNYNRLTENTEIISASGPTSQQLHVVAALRDSNPGIYYEYWAPKDKHYFVTNNASDFGRSSTLIKDSNQLRRTSSNDQLIGKSLYNNNRKWNPMMKDAVSDETVNHLAYHKYQIDNQRDRNWNDVSIRILPQLEQNSPSNERYKVAIPTKNKTGCVHCNPRPTKEKKTNRSNKTAGECPVCRRVKNIAKHFCKSDFVIRAIVTNKENVQGKWRYVMEIIQSFKNNVPMQSREYIWIRGRCLCPKLRLEKEYILMGYSDHSRRENRLLIDRKCYARRYKRSKASQLLSLMRNGCAAFTS